jgi:glycosyltransferase involved in cell wall biosynthesis
MEESGAAAGASAGNPPVVFLIASYAPSLWMFRGHLIEELIGKGYRVLACAPPYDGAAERMRALGAAFLPLGPDRTSLNPLADLRYLWKLLRLCIRVRPAVLISYTAKPVIWGSLAGGIAGVRNVVAMVTGLGFAFTDSGTTRPMVSRVVERLYRLALRRCHSVVFQNSDDQREFTQRRLVAAGRGSFVVNGSGVDLLRFQPAALPDTPVFLLVARMLRDKGIQEFCEAAAEVKRKYPEASFRLVGWFDADNPRAITPAELEAWCANGVAEYRGPAEDVREEIARCRIYVLPSYREGTPRTVLEAMAMGRAIITSDAPGCRETVRDGWNGFLVPVRDSAALARAMMSFLSAPHLAEEMGVNSRSLAESKYDGRRVAESILAGAGL